MFLFLLSFQFMNQDKGQPTKRHIYLGLHAVCMKQVLSGMHPAALNFGLS